MERGEGVFKCVPPPLRARPESGVVAGEKDGGGSIKFFRPPRDGGRSPQKSCPLSLSSPPSSSTGTYNTGEAAYKEQPLVGGNLAFTTELAMHVHSIEEYTGAVD